MTVPMQQGQGREEATLPSPSDTPFLGPPNPQSGVLLCAARSKVVAFPHPVVTYKEGARGWKATGDPSALAIPASKAS